MGETTWLFILVGIAVIFPIVMVQVNNYYNHYPDEFEGDTIPSFTSSPITFIINMLGIDDFIDAMGNIPQPVRSIIWILWITLIIYVLVKALPFT